MTHDGPPTKTRINAYRRYEIGTVFQEIDGYYTVMYVSFSGGKDPTYDYSLKKMTPEEVTVWEVLRS